MKKTIFQISSLLSQSSYKSEQDFKRIVAICQAEEGFNPNVSYEIDPVKGITVIDFIEWVDHGFGVGDICSYEDNLVILGICHLGGSVIVGKLLDDEILICDEKVAQKALKCVSGDCRHEFMAKMCKNGLQFSHKDQKLMQKYIPLPLERVIFTSDKFSGLGVVKEIHFDTDSVDYFCYYINESGKIGFSMNEVGITGLSDVMFEPMNNGPYRQTSGNGIYLQRKFNKELSRYGKVWNEKLHRIEPVNTQKPIGEKYYFIDDKMILRMDTEKGTPTSKKRWYVGNYFWTHAEGLEYLGKFTEMLRDRLATPGINEYEK